MLCLDNAFLAMAISIKSQQRMGTVVQRSEHCTVVLPTLPGWHIDDVGFRAVLHLTLHGQCCWTRIVGSPTLLVLTWPVWQGLIWNLAASVIVAPVYRPHLKSLGSPYHGQVSLITSCAQAL